MKLRNAVLTFSDEDGNNHEAFFCFYKERGSGIRTNINSENPWLTMINATPQEVVTELWC
jgi:hypothetical protein